MPDLTITVTLTAEILAVVAVFDLFLVAVGLAAYRRIRTPARPTARG